MWLQEKYDPQSFSVLPVTSAGRKTKNVLGGHWRNVLREVGMATTLMRIMKCWLQEGVFMSIEGWLNVYRSAEGRGAISVSSYSHLPFALSNK